MDQTIIQTQTKLDNSKQHTRQLNDLDSNYIIQTKQSQSIATNDDNSQNNSYKLIKNQDKDHLSQQLLNCFMQQQCDQTAEIIQSLLKQGADPNIVDGQSKRNCLILFVLSAFVNDEIIADQILEKIVDINVIDIDGKTALYYAVDLPSENTNLIKKLLNKNANPNVELPDKSTSLMRAVQLNRTSTVEMLISQGKANVNIQILNQGDTPLHIAVRNNNKQIVKLLDQANANFMVLNKNINQSPLDICINHQDLQEILQKWQEKIKNSKRVIESDAQYSPIKQLIQQNSFSTANDQYVSSINKKHRKMTDEEQLHLDQQQLFFNTPKKSCDLSKQSFSNHQNNNQAQNKLQSTIFQQLQPTTNTQSQINNQQYNPIQLTNGNVLNFNISQTKKSNRIKSETVQVQQNQEAKSLSKTPSQQSQSQTSQTPLLQPQQPLQMQQQILPQIPYLQNIQPSQFQNMPNNFQNPSPLLFQNPNQLNYSYPPQLIQPQGVQQINQSLNNQFQPPPQNIFIENQVKIKKNYKINLFTDEHKNEMTRLAEEDDKNRQELEKQQLLAQLEQKDKQLQQLQQLMSQLSLQQQIFNQPNQQSQQNPNNYENLEEEFMQLSQQQVSYYLNVAIDEFYQKIQEYHALNQNNFDGLLKKIQNIIKSNQKIQEVEVYGSHATGLHLPWSDIDLVLILNQQVVQQQFQNGSSTVQVLTEIEQQLSQVDFIDKMNLIKSATIPVLKVQCKEIYLQKRLDITVQDSKHNGIIGVQLIKKFLLNYPPLQKIALVLKEFIYQSGLYDTYQGGLSSYGLILMIVSFLQSKLSNTDKINKTLIQWSSNGQYLLEFLYFYGFDVDYLFQQIYCHDPDQEADQPYFKTVNCNLGQQMDFFGQIQKKLCIQDPLNKYNIIGRTTYKIQYIKMAFCIAFVTIHQNYKCSSKPCQYCKEYKKHAENENDKGNTNQGSDFINLGFNYQKARPCYILERMFLSPRKLFPNLNQNIIYQ